MSISLAMSGDVKSAARTDDVSANRAVQTVRDRATEFARLSVGRKAELLRECMRRLADIAPEWVAEGARAKGLTGAHVGEEWSAGPWVTMRGFRLTAESLEAVERHGKPPLGMSTSVRPDGRLVVEQLPASGFDKVTFGGFRGYALMQPGVNAALARQRQASFYGQAYPEGRVALVLGAGNVSSIPPLDIASKMFVDGEACVLKVNPVNEWVGPILERFMSPLIDRGYLRVVYGGADVGAYLCEHAGVDSIHITGSDRTHDRIVWGPPEAQQANKAAGRRVNERPISSELGNVSPVAIVPGEYTEEQLAFQARNVVSMVFNNGSFNCNAAKVLITAKGWRQRERFLTLVADCLAEAPLRKAYYPGARERYDELTGGRDGVERFGQPAADELAWAFLRGLDPKDTTEPLFTTEPFCGVLSETALDVSDPGAFLHEVTPFMNDRLWGTLNATLIIHPRLEQDPSVEAALDQAIVDLRYGTVAINHWPAVCYAVGSMAWGGHPSATLDDIQSGLGWVHNAFMLEGIEKSVVRGPLVVKPTPPWFYDHRRPDKLGPHLVRLEADPRWYKLAGVLKNAL